MILVMVLVIVNGVVGCGVSSLIWLLISWLVFKLMILFLMLLLLMLMLKL